MRVTLLRRLCLAFCMIGACSEAGMRGEDVSTAGSPATPGAAGADMLAAAGTSMPVAGASGGTSAAGSGGAGFAGGAGTSIAGDGGKPAAAGSGGAGTSAAGGGGMSAAGMLAAGSGGGMSAAGALAAGSGGTVATPAITVWIAGDSTVANGSAPCPIGWGADFPARFTDKAKIVNSAIGGRSVRTWLYNVQTTMGSDGECLLAKDANGEPTVQARWQRMLDEMHDGDYLFVQFGINDSSATCDRHVGPEAFKDSYGMMAMAAKQRGAQPIFLTPVSSISCDGTNARGTRGRYVTATQEAAKEYDVPLIDLHALSVALYTSSGLCPIPGGGDVSASTGGKTGAFFCEDHTHFERSGADQIAGLIVKALRDQHIGLAAYLK